MTLEQRSERLAALLAEKRGIGGEGLERKLKRAGRSLPRWVRRETRALVEARALEQHPKLVRRVDYPRIERGIGRVEAWLAQQDPWERRKAWMIGFAAANAFNVLVVFTLVVSVLVWRGYV